MLFLSTLSLRRATSVNDSKLDDNIHFYPRSPCGERQLSSIFLDIDYCISIHALLAESDPFVSRLHSLLVYFYPRSPCGERHSKDVHSGL